MGAVEQFVGISVQDDPTDKSEVDKASNIRILSKVPSASVAPAVKEIEFPWVTVLVLALIQPEIGGITVTVSLHIAPNH